MKKSHDQAAFRANWMTAPRYLFAKRAKRPRPSWKCRAGVEDPIGRIPRWLGQARVPNGDVRRGCQRADARSREGEGKEDDEGNDQSSLGHLKHCASR